MHFARATFADNYTFQLFGPFSNEDVFYEEKVVKINIEVNKVTDSMDVIFHISSSKEDLQIFSLFVQCFE